VPPSGVVTFLFTDIDRLQVGSRRGVERHQTLRHAVAWSYALLDEPEKALLERCSVFAGGFDLQSACAVADTSDTQDEFAVLNLLDALVRKSLLVADRSTGRTRFSMLETIRQFAEEQLAAPGEATEARYAHARHFAGREADILARWDSPQQREAYAWFTTELANLRTAFRWAADHDDLDVAATIASYAGFLGFMVENYEPIAWAEDMIEPARAVNHPRLPFLYVIASWCYVAGRLEEAVRYCDAGQTAVINSPDRVLFGFDRWLGGVHNFLDQPERSIEWSRLLLARSPDPYANIRAGLVFGLLRAGSRAEAVAVAKDLIEAADAIANPWALSFVLLAYGIACGDVDSVRARGAMRRGLVIAQDSGNRYNETHLASILGRLEARHGDPLAALDYLALAIRNYHDSGNNVIMQVPLAVLGALLDRLGRHEPAATIAGLCTQSRYQGVEPRDQHRDRTPTRRPGRTDT
jgi:hypothetical protein